MVREIKVYQGEDKATLFDPENVCFIALVSLKKPTPRGTLDHQRTLNPKFHLNSPTQNLDSVSLAPDIDIPPWIAFVEANRDKYKDFNHPIEVRKRDMSDSNDTKQISERIQVLICFIWP